MLRENLIFKYSFILSTAIHLAGFGFFAGSNNPFTKAGTAPDNSNIVVYEIGFKEDSIQEREELINKALEQNLEKQPVPQNKESDPSVQGSSGLDKEERGGVKEEYLLLVRKRIESFKFYPREAERRRLRGSVKLSFSIDENGIARAVYIMDSSMSLILDKTAKEIIIRANPFPKPPSPDLGRIQTTIVFT